MIINFYFEGENKRLYEIYFYDIMLDTNSVRWSMYDTNGMEYWFASPCGLGKERRMKRNKVGEALATAIKEKVPFGKVEVQLG